MDSWHATAVAAAIASEVEMAVEATLPGPQRHPVCSQYQQVSRLQYRRRPQKGSQMNHLRMMRFDLLVVGQEAQHSPLLLACQATVGTIPWCEPRLLNDFYYNKKKG